VRLRKIRQKSQQRACLSRPKAVENFRRNRRLPVGQLWLKALSAQSTKHFNAPQDRHILAFWSIIPMEYSTNRKASNR
jgi:hypothetical protein